MEIIGFPKIHARESCCEEIMEKTTEKLSEERKGRCDNPNQHHLKQLHHTVYACSGRL